MLSCESMRQYAPFELYVLAHMHRLKLRRMQISNIEYVIPPEARAPESLDMRDLTANGDWLAGLHRPTSSPARCRQNLAWARAARRVQYLNDWLVLKSDCEIIASLYTRTFSYQLSHNGRYTLDQWCANTRNPKATTCRPGIDRILGSTVAALVNAQG